MLLPEALDTEYVLWGVVLVRPDAKPVSVLHNETGYRYRCKDEKDP